MKTCKKNVILYLCFFSFFLFRSPEMNVVLESIFTQDSIKKGVTFVPGVTLSYTYFNDLMQKESVNGEEQNSNVCKFHFQRFMVFFLSKISCLLLAVQVSSRGWSKEESSYSA